MKKEDVPQDASNLSKSNLRELVYATDENGNYTTALSSGWEPKTIALTNSIEEINKRIARAREDVRCGTMSPICYFMEVQKMDLNVLSSYVGMAKWRVRRHCQPSVFARLHDAVLQKYADTIEISIDQLRNFSKE